MNIASVTRVGTHIRIIGRIITDKMVTPAAKLGRSMLKASHIPNHPMAKKSARLLGMTLNCQKKKKEPKPAGMPVWSPCEDI